MQLFHYCYQFGADDLVGDYVVIFVAMYGVWLCR